MQFVGIIADKIEPAVSTTTIGYERVGRVIDGRFPLLRCLDESEQSSVYLTEFEGDERAAIKLISPSAEDAETRIARWAATRNLNHPHLMRLLAGGRCSIDGEDHLYVVTECADEVLSDILRERALSSGEIGEMLDPILEVFSFLHARNLLHGHLKSSNIMVAGDRLKLSSDRIHSARECGFGWPDRYTAPEASGGKITAAADLWSLGMVLVEALTQGTPHWDGTRGHELVLPATMPPPFDEIAGACLRVDPARRWSVREVRDFLADGAHVDAGSRTQPSRGRMVIGGMVLVAAGVSAAMVIGSHHRVWSPGLKESSVVAAHPRPQVSVVQSAPQVPAVEPRPVVVANPQRSVARGRVVKGAVLEQPTPDVPEHIRDGIQGHIHVRISVQVDASGSVADAAIDTPGPSQYFARQALEAARKWKFKPAEAEGSGVTSRWVLEFVFSQDGTTITPTETAP